MKEFMNEDFLLTTETARRLYHDYAETMPIFDFHNHLSAQEIYEDINFPTLHRHGSTATIINGAPCVPMDSRKIW